MYHLYKLYGDAVYEESKLSAFKNEPHSITTRISTLVTFSPQFFRNELEIGLSILGIQDGDIPQYSDMMALDAFVINPLLDLLNEYRQLDRTGAKCAAEEMTDVLLGREGFEDFPERQIELIKMAAGIIEAE